MPKSNSLLTYTLAAVSCAVAGIVLFSSADVRAQEYEYEHEREHRGRLMLALDFDYSSAIRSPEIRYGGGGALRIGSQRNLFLVTLIPELLFDYHSYGSDQPDSAQIVTGKIGGRIRFLKIVEPGLFAHIGLGHVGGYDVISHTGVAFDAGLTLDLTILPLIDIGLHGSWNRIFGGFDEGTSYATAGAHVALVL
jgi:hypothetical protein